ncbi:uncharacterized protein LOC132747821 isoform X3 [Ruditapes philippinarum]|uniref:uncharacterized protein LOC132747821 isoform X3 n=2 Tax=Ruditapes philippinarum TaxID=129788 RepID=UPI00295C3262|nr:uncharacterized protein LOC132747821 isoform X3 [Ruditapes philippinarum]
MPLKSKQNVYLSKSSYFNAKISTTLKMASKQYTKRGNSRDDNNPGNRGQDRGQQQGQRRNSSSQGEGQQGRERRNQRNPVNNRNQNQENQSDRGQNQAQRNNRGQHHENQTNRGQYHGNQGNRGHFHGNQSDRGHNHGNQSNRGHSRGNQSNRGHNYGNQINNGQFQGQQDFRGQNLPPSDNRGQTVGCGCGPNNQRGFYPGPSGQEMGHFPRPRFPGQSPGLLPDPGPNAYNDPRHMQYPHVQYPDMMRSGPYNASSYRPPMHGYVPGMPPHTNTQPPPLMDYPCYPNEQFRNTGQRNQGQPGFDGRNGPGMMGNMERSQSSMSIDSVGSEHDGRKRNFRGRGGRPFERGRGNGRMNRASSTQSINSVGSERHDDRNNKGRGGMRDRPDNRSRQNNTSDNGARPKQYENINTNRSETVDNSNQHRRRGPRNERGRGRGRGTNFRGNQRPLDNRDTMSNHSEQISVWNVSDESDDSDKNQERQPRSVRGRGRGNGRRFCGRDNRSRFRGRGNRGVQNFRGRGRSPIHTGDNGQEKEIERLNLTEDKTKLDLLNRFLRSNRGVVSGSRRGRGRFFRGRWIGHVGNRRKKDDDVSSVWSNVESDDHLSISSEVSSAVPDSVSEGGQDQQKYEICLDDVYTVQLHTLRNRVMRYKRKLADMRKKNEDKEEINKYQDKINEIKAVIQKREDSEKKTMEKKASNTCKKKGKKKTNDENTGIPDERRETSSAESETEMKVRDVQTKLKKMHSFNTAKGHISFRPKTKKVAKKKTVDKTLEPETFDADSADSSVTVEYENVLEEENEPVKVEKKKRPRNRNRKKKNLGGNGDDTKCTEKEQKLNDLLVELESISLEENKSGKQENCNDSGLSSKSRGSSVNDCGSFISDYSTMNDSHVGNETPQKERNEALPGKIPEKRVRGGSESNANGPDVNEVFKFMVKILSGKGTPEEINRESGLFPLDFDEKSWFRKLKRRFTIIDRDGVIEMVLVSNRDATYCLDYITNRSCSKADCKRYHVCKNLLAGNCVYGDRCKFSHDLLDEWNMIVSKRLGYSNVFTSQEICYILQVRYPHICHNWIDNGFCEEPSCIGLHLCPRYLIGQCLEGEACQLVHDKCSTHNKPIVDAYGMGNWVESIFKRMVYMKREPGTETKEEETEIVNERSRHVSETEDNKSSVRKRHNSQNAPELENSAGDRAICDKYIIGKCRRQRCRFLHTQTLSPYIWQVQLCGNWINLDNIEQIEKAYCEHEDFSQEIRLMYKDMQFSVVIVFKPSIRAVAVVIGTEDGGIHTEVRRLSTKSYKEDDDDKNSFKTQWRWYWKDDYSRWNLFDQEAMQHTLEVKYLAKQKDFNYSRENYRFKYVIDFKEMKQRNIGTRKVREISRLPIFVPLQNVAGKQFPTALSAAPAVETPLPDKWVPWDLAHPFELVTIEENSEIYTWVSDNFYRTLSRTEIQIDTIFRMQNYKLRSLYCNQEKSMLANLKRLGKEGPIYQRYLFHGTDSLDAVRGISINNLDNRVSGKNATMYGDGAYFARDAKYSHAYTGSGPERFMFLVTVLVGDYTLGDRSYRRPPNKPGNDHELYDSCVNNIDNPSIYIVFDKNQYYPEYLIQYHKQYEDFHTSTVPKPRKPVVLSGHGAVGGLNTGVHQPAVFPTRRRSPSPPVLVYPPTSSSTRTSVSPPRLRTRSPPRVVYPHSSTSASSAGGHSSVQYVSSSGSHSTPRRQDPVSPQKKNNDSSCSIQ